MAKCALGPKKLRRISQIVGDAYTVRGALVRGGWTHYVANVFLIEKATDKHVCAWVNYKTGEWELAEGALSTWREDPRNTVHG